MIASFDWAGRGSEGGRLGAFAKAVCVYFAVASGGAPSAAVALFKCAPLLCLMAAVRRAPGPYARRVLAGLALSAAGDALLVWPQRLPAGMAAFAGAHVAYIAAFGWRPARAGLGALAYAATALYVRALSPPPALRVPVPAYAALLATMAWRAAARPGAQRLGALLFLLSDALLGYSLFGGNVPYKQVVTCQAAVMSTYYAAQLCIALSALPRAAGDGH